MFRKTKIGSAAAIVAAGVLLTGGVASAQDQRVEITGSSIKRIEAEGALPVQVITRKEIEKSGAVNVEQLLQSVSANASSGGLTASSASGATTGGISAISLRGLTSIRTLVLINGRRIAPYGIGFTGDSVSVDVNSIPLAAIERVEVLKDGASAVYGSDAVAGVVNFILRKDYTGAEITGTYGDTSDGGANLKRVTATWGYGDLGKDRFNVMLVGSFQKEGALFGRDRSFANSGINVDAQNDTTSGNTFPANIFLVTSGLTRNPAAPQCPPPYSTLDPLFPPNRCRFDPSPLVTLLPDSERASVFGSFRFAINNETELFLEASYNRNKQRTVIQPVPISDQFALPDNHPLFNVAPYNGFSTILINPGSPNYPTAYVQSVVGAGNPLEPILVRYRSNVTGNRDLTDTSTAPRVTGGIRGAFVGWDYDAAFLWSQSKVTEHVNGGFPALSQILPILNNGTVNFWGPNTPAVDAQLQATQFLGDAFNIKSTLSSLAGKASRELTALPGGPLAIALGAELRREDFLFDPNPTIQTGDISGYGGNFLPTDKSRNVEAAFGEIVVPIIKGLDVTGAVRYDHYQGVGNSTTPKASVRWQPLRQVLVRGSVGKGFRAPSLQDLYLPNTTGVTVPGLSDPLRCPTTNSSNDCQTQFPVLFGGNQNLKPEKSNNATLGLVLEPVTGTSIAVDYFKVDLKETIVNGVTPPVILGDLTKYGSLVRRGPVDPAFPTLPGPITQIDQTNINLGRTKVAGIDIDARSGYSAGEIGRFNFSLNGTYFIKYDTQNLDGTFTGGIDQVNAATGGVVPRWKHYAAVDWTQGPWTVTLAQNFQKHYTDLPGTFEDPTDPAFVPRRVGSYETYDAQVAYSGIKSLRLTLGVRNLFNRAPPYTNAGGQTSFQAGYDPQYGDPRGRFMYVTARYEFK